MGVLVNKIKKMNLPIIRHGEVILKPVSKLPENAVLESLDNKIVVAHSETGHHHVLQTLDMSKIKVYSWNGSTYLEVPEIANLWHHKTGKHIHKTHKVLPSAYEVVIKKEYDYFAKAIRQVRD